MHLSTAAVARNCETDRQTIRLGVPKRGPLKPSDEKSDCRSKSILLSVPPCTDCEFNGRAATQHQYEVIGERPLAERANRPAPSESVVEHALREVPLY